MIRSEGGLMNSLLFKLIESKAPFIIKAIDAESSLNQKMKDYLVELIAKVIGNRGGVRMTGGGFGGCVIALVPDDQVESVKSTVASDYVTPEGSTATIYECGSANGVTIVQQG